MLQKLFARLREDNFLAQPVQKATARFRFQRLHRVADARLREVQLARRLRETARAGEHAERPKLSAVERRAHL